MSESPYRGEAPPRRLLITTTDTLETHRVVRYIGIVHGESKLTETTNFRPLVELHHEAFQSLEFHAHQIGASAVVGLRYSVQFDTRGATVTSHVSAYGTAVVVEPI